MKKLTISEVISQAWELTKKNWLTLLGLVIVCEIITYIVGLILGPSIDPMVIQQLLEKQNDPTAFASLYMTILPDIIKASLIQSIISIILLCGVYQFLLDSGRGNGTFSMDLWKRPAGNYVQYFLTTFIVGFIIYLGTLLCILPGLFFAARLQFASFYTLDHKESNCIDAIKASWNMTDGHTLDLILIAVVYVGILLLGLLCCCVGIIPAYMVVAYSVTVCYLTLLPATPVNPGEQQEYAKE